MNPELKKKNSDRTRLLFYYWWDRGEGDEEKEEKRRVNVCSLLDRRTYVCMYKYVGGPVGPPRRTPNNYPTPQLADLTV